MSKDKKEKWDEYPDVDIKQYNELFSNKYYRRKALEIALDTRKFEIDLYWKRATYFWAFIAASFAGYFALLSSDQIDHFRGLTIVISIIGFFFSLGWYFANRGSKFWQENWEEHVSNLIEEDQVSIFNIVTTPTEKFRKLTGNYPFSVSKINQVLSLIVTIVWIVLLFGSVIYTLHFKDNFLEIISFINSICLFWVIIIISLLIGGLSWLFAIFTRSFAYDKLKEYNEEKKKKSSEDGNDNRKIFFYKGNNETIKQKLNIQQENKTDKV